MTMYTVWGGEPLLVEDLPAWLRRARELGMMTTVCTSGFRLPERASELAGHVDQLLLSLEAVGARQDQIRATPGLFERLSRGLQEFKRRSRGDVIVWSNLSRENRDQIQAIAQWARDEKVGVEFFPAALYPGYNEKLVLSPAERVEVFTEVLDLKKQGYPIANTAYALELMRSGRPFRCNLPRLAVQVSAQGEIYHCEPRLIPDLTSLGNLEQMDFQAFARSRVYRQGWKKLSTCNACLFPCVANMADSLLLQALRRAGNRLRYRSHF
jgi:MoaA/NifB/PqqE/SkfB family radical SAM enzyme